MSEDTAMVMTFDDALLWLEEHKDVAGKWYNKWRKYTPYAYDDFQSVVTEAVLVATNVANNNGIRSASGFEAVFVRTLQNKICDVVPGYGQSDEFDRSVGPDEYYDFDDLTVVMETQTLPEHTPEYNLLDEPTTAADIDLVDHAYGLVESHLNDSHGLLLRHAVGIGQLGRLSLREMEGVIGIKKSTAKRHLDKLFGEVIPELVNSGVVRPYIPISF